MRKIPVELTKRYEDEGWWRPETLGDLVAGGLAANPGTGFCVHSAVRPFDGTFADVELHARRLAEGLRKRGVGPGDVVALQLPNWMEAAARIPRQRACPSRFMCSWDLPGWCCCWPAPISPTCCLRVQEHASAR